MIWIGILLILITAIADAGSPRWSARGTQLGLKNIKGKLSISGNLNNMLIGPVIYAQHYQKRGDLALILDKKIRNGVWEPVTELDMPEIKKSYLDRTNLKKRSQLNKGYFEFKNLESGIYRITFKSRRIRLFGWRTRLLFEDSEHFVKLENKDMNAVKFPLKLSGLGKFFYYSLVCLGFMLFFIGISLIVIQRVAFRDIKFLSYFGVATIFLTWSVILVKIPTRTSLPVFLVQFMIFMLVYLKKDYNNLPLPFITSSFIQSKDDYLYNTAISMSELTDDSATALRFQDKWHNLVTIRGKCFEGEGPIAVGTEVHLIEYDHQRDLFYVQTTDQVTGAA